MTTPTSTAPETLTRFDLPTLLTWDGAAMKPGRGDAGWTVYSFASAAERAAFMAAHPEAAMPCWGRL